LTVGRDDNVGHEVVVSLEDTFRETEGFVVAGKLPDNDTLVCQTCLFKLSSRIILPEHNAHTSRRGEDHVRVFSRSSDGGDPAFVAAHLAHVP
jgi:cytochrome c-type biogenesis protein CcmE